MEIQWAASEQVRQLKDDAPLNDKKRNDGEWPELKLPQPQKHRTWKVELAPPGTRFKLWESQHVTPDFRVTALFQKRSLNLYFATIDQWQIWMSDSIQERYMMRNAAEIVSGRVLVGGLGLGMFPQYALSRKAEEIVVVEKNPTILEITGPIMEDFPSVEIVNGDIFEYLLETEETFDHAYYDIWENISTDNLPQMNWLRIHSQRVLNKGGRALCWGHAWSLNRFQKECADTYTRVIRPLPENIWREKRDGMEHLFPMDFEFAKWALQKERRDEEQLTEKKMKTKARQIGLRAMAVV